MPAEMIVLTVSIIVLVIGVGLFLASGFIHVKKGYTAIVERVGLYVETLTKSWTWFAPLLYRRAGYYKLGPNKTKVKLVNEKEMLLYYEIINVLLFHYSGHNITNIIHKATHDNKGNLTVDILKESLLKIGIRFIDAEEIKKEG